MAPYLVKHGGYDLREDLVTPEINTERLPNAQRRSFEKNQKRGRENFGIPIFSSKKSIFIFCKGLWEKHRRMLAKLELRALVGATLTVIHRQKQERQKQERQPRSAICDSVLPSSLLPIVRRNCLAFLAATSGPFSNCKQLKKKTLPEKHDRNPEAVRDHPVPKQLLPATTLPEVSPYSQRMAQFLFLSPQASETIQDVLHPKKQDV